MVQVGDGLQRQEDDQRKCGRLIWDFSDVVQRIRNRVRLFVPDIARLDRQAELTGGSAIIWGEVWEVSTDDNILHGGATTFHSRNMKRRYDVLPKTGRVLIFQHKTSDIRVTMLFKVSSTQ